MTLMWNRPTPERLREIRNSIGNLDVINELLAEIDAITKVEYFGGKPTVPLPQRAWDLLRYCRGELARDQLISAEEYAALLGGVGEHSDGSAAARRLEDYDALHERFKKLEAELAFIYVNWPDMIDAVREGRKLTGVKTGE